MSDVVEQEAAPVEGVTVPESATEEQQELQEGEVKLKGGFQKRIDKLTKSNTQLEEEKEYWRKEALRTQNPEAPKITPSDKEPSEDDFQTHAEYIKAVARHEAKQAAKEAVTAERSAETAKTQQQKATEAFQAREAEFKAAIPDFDEVMAEAGDVQVSDAVIYEIVSSENGPQLKYYLAKNPDEAARLSKLNPIQVAREVGRIESRFSTSQAEAPPVKTTGAPPPPTPTGKNSATATKDPGEMSPSEYKVWRAKQNAK